MAVLRRRLGQHQVLGPRPDRPRQRRRPRRGVAVAVGQPRPPHRLLLSDDAARGRGRALRHRGLAAQRGGHRRGHRRDPVDVPPRRGRARRHGAGAGELGPGGGVLDGRGGRRARHPRHPGLSPRGPRRRDRLPHPRLRRGRRGRPLRRHLRRARPPRGGERPDRPQLARHGRRRRDRGRGGPARHRPRAGVPGRVRARLRRAHRRAALDLPHHSPARRVRQRDVGERLVALQREHRGVGPDVRRPGAGLRVPARRDPHQRPLRRPPARRQPVRREPGVPRRADRRAGVALPAHPPRHLGLRHPDPAGPGRHHRRRPRDQGGGPGDQAGVHLRVRPGHRRAGVAHRGAAGARVDGARRAGGGDPAVPDPARPVRPPGSVERRPHRLHAGDRGRGAAHRVRVPDGPHLHAADPGRAGRPARPADAAADDRRRELAGGRGGRRDRHPLRGLGHEPHRRGARERPRPIDHGLRGRGRAAPRARPAAGVRRDRAPWASPSSSRPGGASPPST